MASILIVDDEQDIRDLLEAEFTALDHRVETSATIGGALSHSSVTAFDVIFLDIRLPDGSGLKALPELRASAGSPEIIIMTAFGDPDGAELAVKNGAWDYLQKPVSIDHIALTLQRAIRFREQARQTHRVRVMDDDGVVGRSPRLKACLAQVATCAPTHANVLISGETGTGKELFAHLIHRNSSRKQMPFIIVDCASLPDKLAESILFGHKRGAFTGADRSQPGLLRQAHRGTLFLDEVGELLFALQKNLLRVLQERRYRPVGDIREQHSDFRLLAATNRDLASMVATGAFRQDLLYRLNTIGIQLPPLRQRHEDIKALAIHFANQGCRRAQIPEKGFSQDFFQMLEAYDWPGNVRELSNTMELVLAQAFAEPILFAKHLPVEMRAKGIKAAVRQSRQPLATSAADRRGDTPPPDGQPLPTFREYRDQQVERAERDYLLMLIERAKGNQRTAQRIAGLARTRLWELFKKHGLRIAGSAPE